MMKSRGERGHPCLIDLVIAKLSIIFALMSVIELVIAIVALTKVTNMIQNSEQKEPLKFIECLVDVKFQQDEILAIGYGSMQ